MQADGSNFDEKYENFSKEMQEKIEAKIEGFFIKKFNEDPLYKTLFHNILNYLDNKDLQIPEIYSDKNHTYIENDYLKSVNNLSKKGFLNYYYTIFKTYQREQIFLSQMLEDVMSENNPSSK